MTTTGSATSSSTDTVLTSDQMLANAKAAAVNTTATGAQTAVQKLLAGRDPSDTVELSPVAKILAAQTATATAAKSTSYFDSDDYLTAKVASLKGQIALYSTLPDLDPSGGVLDDLTKQVNDLVTKQKAKLKESTDAAAAKQAELDKANANKYAGVSSTDMLSRAKSLATTGKLPDAAISSDAQALIDKVSGKTVNTTA